MKDAGGRRRPPDALPALMAALSAPSFSVAAEGQQDKKGAKKPADPKTWMSLRGPLLWEEHFENNAYSKEWSRYKGNYVVEKGQLKVAEVAGDGHLPTMTRSFKESNVIIQFSFKFEGAKWLGFQLDDATNDAKKEHVAQLTIMPDAFRIEKMTGFGPTTRNMTVDQRKMKFDPGAWHTIVFEIVGDEMMAVVDVGHRGEDQVHSQLRVHSHPIVDGWTPRGKRPAPNRMDAAEYPIQTSLG